MIIPGGNLLGLALTVIQRQKFLYFPYVKRTLNELGVFAATYASGEEVTGSVQPVERTLYSNLGLDFQKNYYNFFVPRNILDISRDITGDQFQYEGKNFQAQSRTNWHGVDGWDQILCVQVTKF